MTVLAGGLRTRMIFDNLYGVINVGLSNIGWFEAGRRHAPISMVAEEQDSTQEVPVNTLAVSDENVSSQVWEVGSQLSQDTRYFYVDFFGESDAVSKHIIGDVRDILLGKFPSVGLKGPVLPVYDLSQATPTVVFSCDIIRVTVDRSHDYTHPWMRHWYSLQVSLLDYYDNQYDGGPYGAI